MRLCCVAAALFTHHACGLLVNNRVDEGNGTVREIGRLLHVPERIGAEMLFGYQSIKYMLKELFFENCTATLRNMKCNLCVTAEDFISWHGYLPGKKVSEKEFRKLTVGLVYLLGGDDNAKTIVTRDSRNVNGVCKTFKRSVLEKKSDIYNLYLQKYGAEGQLTKSSVQNLLENVNKTIGHRLTGQKCFTSQDIVSASTASPNGFAAGDLEDATTFIILNLLRGSCIAKPLKLKLPSPDYFIQTIFQKFGNETHMDNEGFTQLYLEVFRNRSARARGRSRRDTKIAKTCYTSKELMEIFSFTEGSIITQRRFKEVAPAFIELMESRVCLPGSVPTNAPVTGKTNSTWGPWFGAMVSIAIISFGSLIGIFTFRNKSNKYFPYVIIFFVSLGLSVLICDAMLHLIPHALGLHESGNNDPFASSSYLWKCVLVLAGVYIFFTFELMMATFTGGSHGHSHAAHHDASTEYLTVDVKNDTTDGVENGLTTTGNGEVTTRDKPPPERKKKFRIKDIKTVAWLILIGDGIHNFMDGVAIGAVFSEPYPAGLQGGIMTSIAIFIHEVPHELGDFAILISSGLSLKVAFILNLLSSLTAFIGGIVGLLLGTNWNSSAYIFAVTGGLFIYIALADMLPEIMRSPLLKTSPKTAVCIDVLGLLVGLVVMVMLAAYEDSLIKVLN